MLKHCPFCGSHDVNFYEPYETNEIKVAYCLECGAEGPNKGENDSQSESEAAELWNSRK